MKKTFLGIGIFALACFSAYASDCPSLVGNFISTDGTNTPLAVTQDHCKSVTFDYTSGGEILECVYTTDGVRRQTAVDQGDPIYITSDFSGGNMVSTMEIVNPKTLAEDRVITQFSLSNGHLLSQELDYDVTGTLVRTVNRDYAPAAQ